MRNSTDLRPYQKAAIKRMVERNEQALFADMGTGKTAITLYALQELGKPCTLIVSTLRVVSLVWMQEALEWEDLELSFSLVTGTARRRTEALQAPADIYLININNIQWLLDQPVLPPFEVLVLDELSLWKGRGKWWKTLRKHRGRFNRTYGLTGTPTPNGLIDLWPQMELIRKGCLSRTLTLFRQRWFYSDYMGYNWTPRPDAEDEILRQLQGDVVRISNSELDMPSLAFDRMKVNVPVSAAELMENLQREELAEVDGHSVSAESKAVLGGKLQQMCNGCVYTDDGSVAHVHDAKLQALDEIRQELQGAPMLVAYWYNHDLAALRTWDVSAPMLGAGTSETDAARTVERWNAGQLPVLFVHPASAGHGLNLQGGGHHLVWYSMTWDLDKFDQLNARLCRSGQQAATVFVHLLIGGAIDTTIADALVNKHNVQQAVLEYFECN